MKIVFGFLASWLACRKSKHFWCLILSEILVYDGALYIAEHIDDGRRFDLLLVSSL